jgi:hypothetical protein
MNKSRRAIYRLDSVNKLFYTYCLFYSVDPNKTRHNKNFVFYVGKAKRPTILAHRREREHIREAYHKTSWHFHKSRKIRLLEKKGYFIMSKVLEEFDDETEAYLSEKKWQKIFLDNGNDLTNMIQCGIKSVGSGKDHPSFNTKIRKSSTKIINRYTNDFWSIQKICRYYKISQKTAKKILFEESNLKQRPKNLRSTVWASSKGIIAAYQQGIPAYKLAQKYKCAINTITYILRTNNIQIRTKHKPRKSSRAWQHKHKIIKYFLSGKTKTWISQKYKCDISCTINPILKEANLL